MSTQVQINGTNYNLPVQGDDSGWGEPLSAIIEALVEVAGATTTVGDIFTKTFTLSNNVSSPTAITGLIFSPSAIRSAIVSLSIHRATSSAEKTETGLMFIGYRSLTSDFTLSRVGGGNAGVNITIDSTGQCYYTSSNLSGLSHSGVIKFSAKVALQ